MLRASFKNGAQAAFAKFGLAQPSLGSVGITAPVKAPGLPGPAKLPSIGAPSLKLEAPGAGSSGGPGLGIAAAKTAANVGMGASTSSSGTGASPGEPADTGRRQRSAVDRAWATNEDIGATSSMPLPSTGVSP